MRHRHQIFIRFAQVRKKKLANNELWSFLQIHGVLQQFQVFRQIWANRMKTDADTFNLLPVSAV
jgi:hypothetical protein